MNEETQLLGALGIVLCLYAALQIKKKRERQRPRQRQYKTRPINRNRKVSGNQYYQKMKTWDLDEFFKFTRMTISVFDKLLTKVKPIIRKQHRSDGITSEERLVITLQYLSQGTSMQSLARTFNMGHTTVHKIIHETCQALWDVLKNDYLKTPDTEEEWLNISEGFNNRWNFPHCIGSFDGKHVNIQALANSDNKKTLSVVLLASCDYRYRLTSVDFSAYESQSDGGVFRHSLFGKAMEDSDMNVPSVKHLPCTNIPMPYFFVADEAFPIKNIMQPYPGKNLSNKQRVFNYRLSRVRQVIENTFGILVTRWRILGTTIVAKVENVDNIVKAVVVLHNYCQTELSNSEGINIYCPTNFVDTDGEQNGAWRSEQNPLQSVGRISTSVTKHYINSMRDRLSDYFMSEPGRVSWQDIVLNANLSN